MKNILVTGGAGYIGSHTAKVLASNGYQPIVFDNLSMGHEWAVQWGPLVKGDLADKELLIEILKQQRIDAVIHFAAYSYVGESVTNPRKYFRNNVVNTINLIEAMLDVGVNRLVFSSTCAIYGIPAKLPMDETLPHDPINPYGDSKLFVEKMLRWSDAAYGLRSIALRYFNAAGASPAGEIGEDHTPETHLIPLVIYACLGKAEQVKIFGTDYPTPDGTAIRDYIHVMDLAEAHVRALEKLHNGGASAVYNLGTGQGQSVREIISAVERVSGRSVPCVETERRPGDPPVLVADATVAYRELNWRPKYIEVDDIVATAWQWHKKHNG